MKRGAMRFWPALQSDDPEMRYEAARAAGELMIEDAIKHLRKLVLDDDREVKEVAIWSLGEIGGSEATRILQRLANDAENSDDEELIEAIEDALGSATMGNSLVLHDASRRRRGVVTEHTCDEIKTPGDNRAFLYLADERHQLQREVGITLNLDLARHECLHRV